MLPNLKVNKFRKKHRQHIRVFWERTIKNLSTCSLCFLVQNVIALTWISETNAVLTTIYFTTSPNWRWWTIIPCHSCQKSPGSHYHIGICISRHKCHCFLSVAILQYMASVHNAIYNRQQEIQSENHFTCQDDSKHIITQICWYEVAHGR